jgi:hypothetical protein
MLRLMGDLPDDLLCSGGGGGSPSSTPAAAPARTAAAPILERVRLALAELRQRFEESDDCKMEAEMMNGSRRWKKHVGRSGGGFSHQFLWEQVCTGGFAYFLYFIAYICS